MIFAEPHAKNNCSFTDFSGLTCLSWLSLLDLNRININFAKSPSRHSTKFLTEILKWSSTIFCFAKLYWKAILLAKFNKCWFQSPRDVQESINTTGMLNATFLNASYFQYNIVPVIFSYLFESTFFPH